MTAHHFTLTIDVQSPHVDNGIGYMIAFQTPVGVNRPDALAEYPSWSEKVRDAVLRAGDKPFDPDPYTRKVALTHLLHDLEELNTHYGLLVGFVSDTPAVQIQSSNPFDRRIEANLTEENGIFDIRERTPEQVAERGIVAHGRIDVVAGGRRSFPFTYDRAAPARALAPQP